MMRPIRSREEYMTLRDSEQNLRAEKMHMVQMNYSAKPEEPTPEGSVGTALKGCKTPSNTVGMDIDFNPSDPEYSQKMAAVPETIMAKKEELGLLMLERSASKGYHIAFRRRPELSQEENLKWASKLLGVEYDKGAKDITRVFFTPPSSHLIYIDDALFVNEAVEDASSDKNPTVLPVVPDMSTEQAPADSTASLPMAIVPATAFARHAFDLCVVEAGLKPDAMDVWGAHNWHSNLMAVLSVGLPKLMSREQLMAVVREKLPNYGTTDDCRKLIDYFYDNYTADKGFMSASLREINAKAQELSREEAKAKARPTDEEADEEKVVEELTQDWTPPALPKKLPRLMELLVGNYDPRFREMLLLSALPELSALASHYRALYLNGRIIGPQQYVAVIGGSGQGKGCCTSLYRAMTQYTLEENDAREWEKVRANAELRDKMSNAKERPAKYHPRLRLFETTSKSSILELQSNLGQNGMLLGQFSEVDALSGATRQAYSDISVLLRKGWDMDMHRQFYMSDTTCNTYTRMSISLLMTGTAKAMLERMFDDKNCEGGLMQRCIPVVVPRTKRSFRPPRENFLTADQIKERDALLMELYQKDLALGDGTLELELPMTTRAIEQWFDSLEERFNDGKLTEAEADLSHRCGEFIMRAAIPLVALYGKETKEIVAFCTWVGKMAHYAMCQIFGHRVQKDNQRANELLADHSDARRTAEPLLDKLPTIFTTEQFKEQREKDGQSPDVRMLLSRYCKSGKLERVARGVYRKVSA